MSTQTQLRGCMTPHITTQGAHFQPVYNESDSLWRSRMLTMKMMEIDIVCSFSVNIALHCIERHGTGRNSLGSGGLSTPICGRPGKVRSTIRSFLLNSSLALSRSRSRSRCLHTHTHLSPLSFVLPSLVLIVTRHQPSDIYDTADVKDTWWHIMDNVQHNSHGTQRFQTCGARPHLLNTSYSVCGSAFLSDRVTCHDILSVCFVRVF